MSKAIRNEIEKATFLDGKGKKILRIGEGLDKDYGSHCDDRNIMCFFNHRWLPRLMKMTNVREVENQKKNFFDQIPSLAGTEEERKIKKKLQELGLGSKMVSAPVVANQKMNNTQMNNALLNELNNNNMYNNDGNLVYLPKNNALKGGRRRKKTKKRTRRKYKKRRKTRKPKKKHRRRTRKRR